jgi:hypothetical protein
VAPTLDAFAGWLRATPISEAISVRRGCDRSARFCTSSVCVCWWAREVPPRAIRAVAVVSLVSWFLVIDWGRMLPFVTNAF